VPDIVLGVSGSVAAYRAADLARELMRHGFRVHACLTDAAQRFVSTALFEALTGNPCLHDVFDEPERGRMAHIDLARQAAVIVVAPATANTIARLAWGIGDDMLTTLALATEAPLVVAPAMNPHMYASDPTREALAKLRERAATIVEPTDGDVACGESGQGKLASVAEIVAAVEAVARSSEALSGKKVLITSGPTQEPIDDVRFLSNRSSGKMGAALARAARLMGAEVTVVTGPASAPLPLGAQVIRVRTAEEMLGAARSFAADADVIVAAAAVADYRPENPLKGKMRRSDEPIRLCLVPNPDIVAELAKVAPNAIGIGFAAEPTSDLAEVRAKLIRKGLFAIAANDVSDPSIGFESDRNRLRVVFRDRDDVADSGIQSKLGCAFWLFEHLGQPLPG
jgi:phosphopantothenoylcysteine decarboxylase/phosphopantothenate--cysteine ligase